MWFEFSGVGTRHPGRSRSPIGRTLQLAVTLLLAIGATACGEEGVETPEPVDTTEPALPAWLVSVEPMPGQRSASLRRVEVQHRVVTDGENVRLSIDGVDVTSYAEFGREETVGGPGLLVYDFEQARDFLPLDPGEHTATVDRVRLTGIGEEFEILDSYSWSFTIQ